MVDVGAQDAVLPVERVQAVALGQEVLERARLRVERCAVGPVAGDELGPGVGAERAVADLAAGPLDRHVGPVVRDPVRPPGARDGEPAVGVEAQEVDAGLAVDRRVGADVGLGKARDAGDWRRALEAQAGDLEGRDADPGAAVERVDRKLRRNRGAQRLDRHRPVGEEQVQPRLTLEPRPVRERPRTVVALLERAALDGDGGAGGESGHDGVAGAGHRSDSPHHAGDGVAAAERRSTSNAGMRASASSPPVSERAA
jgi:hypothetical protein